MKINLKTKRLNRRHRVRRKLTHNLTRPRLSVFRSNKHIYAQIIDDTKGQTVAAASDTAQTQGTKTEKAAHLGTAIATLARQQGVKTVRFDRGSYKYHGRVKAVAEAARQAGLEV